MHWIALLNRRQMHSNLDFTSPTAFRQKQLAKPIGLMR